MPLFFLNCIRDIYLSKWGDSNFIILYL